MIIDTHCHLDDDRYNELDKVYKRAYDEDVRAFIIPGADPKTLKKAIDICKSRDNTYFGVGVHPYDIDNFDIDFLKTYITHPKCIAVGECGLDYYRLPKQEQKKISNIQKQKEIFIKQIELANEFQKPLIVHIREASKDSLEILQKYANPKLGGVLHCYNASAILLDLAQKNFYFGIGGVLTFKNAKKLVDIVKDIPLDRIVLETDAPYLTPHPHRGERNEPVYTRLILKKLSSILDIEEEVLKKQVLKNSLKLFKDIKLEV